MTAMGVMRNSIEVGLNQLGVNTFQVQKYPVMMGDGEAARRRLRNRKDITYEQALSVREKATLATAVGIEVWDFGKIVWWNGERTNPNIILFGENLDGITTNNWTVDNGRGFTAQDMDLSKPVAVIGKVVANRLFPPSVNPVGETIRIDGNMYEVIGTYATKGDALGGNNDNFVTIPIQKYFEKYGKSGRSVNIMVQAMSRDVVDDAIEQVRGILRIARGVPPGAEDDFAWFSNDSVVRQFNDFTKYVRLGALLISSIALLAAGVGIMNIMLVSVTERTREIGIRKAIGAQQGDVLSQFIIEAVILCEIGGIIGIAFGILGGNVIGLLLNVPAVIPWEWVGIGLMVCTVVGLVFGVYPAWKASALDPIEALRYE
jgi:putative ABC transport system permease protein